MAGSVLRQRLQEITADSTNVDRHRQLIAELRESIPHSIRPSPAKLVPQLPLDRYNCFEFALGLAGDPNVDRIAASFPATSCNTDFLAYLECASVIRPISKRSPAGLVLYRDAQCFTHAGVVQADSVLSKWGVGHLWLHGPWEVPASYGDSLAYYNVVDSPDLSFRFVQFARAREGPIVDEVIQAC